MSAQTLEFKTEVKQLLDLMIHSLYSHKEIFLRELVSNSSDAIDKIRYWALTDHEVAERDEDWKITIIIDKEAGTLTVSDNGCGMNEEEMILALGTIAHSGTKEFIQHITSRDLQNKPDLIGQFGVGFYSAFMVADRVVVISRKAGEPKEKAVRWESSASGTFEVESFEKNSRGTDVILYIKPEEKHFLEPWEIRNVVKKYSDYVEHPIFLEGGNKNDSKDALNSRKALWLKEKSDVTSEEYNEFYKHVSHDVSEPARVVHFKAEGTTEFSALLFIPSRAPFDLFYKEYQIGPMLYVRRVQIMDHCEELLPVYLRFVKGVVESSDLPLNVSREMLQNNRQVDVIKKNIVKKILDALTEWKNTDLAKYSEFYMEFRKALKEGVYSDSQRRESIQDLLLFESTATEAGKMISLKSYVDAMKPDQEAVYYISGASRQELEKSPYLEAFRAKGYDVLLFTDEIDDFIATDMDISGKKLKSVTRGDIALDKAAEADRKEADKKFGKVIDLIKDQLKDDVKDVRFSTRLKDSLCCLVADEGDMDSNMERIMKALGQNAPAAKRILELNPSHPLFVQMQRIFESNKTDRNLADYAALLYDQALILEGSRPKDPVAFSRILSHLMVEHAKPM